MPGHFKKPLKGTRTQEDTCGTDDLSCHLPVDDIKGQRPARHAAAAQPPSRPVYLKQPSLRDKRHRGARLQAFDIRRYGLKLRQRAEMKLESASGCPRDTQARKRRPARPLSPASLITTSHPPPKGPYRQLMEKSEVGNITDAQEALSCRPKERQR
ncbi:hypothetical protein IRJ41_012912 [Triplophysa rosa]|uniref:Uncharacterized protein n=1 Tax=Triplophysa rosa TaxID=992332 RepID=A0A9W7WMB9_TRIRA|nr:hypothetical protein IRJ41_012912 [Triplophysa rosa]